MLEPEGAVALPEKIDDEYLLEDGIGVQPAGIPSILEAFIVTANIFEVIEGARKTSYGSLKRSLNLPELTEVLQLNGKIDHIENTLPPHLQCVSDYEPKTARDVILKLQAEAVMTRYGPVYLFLVLNTSRPVYEDCLTYLTDMQDPSPPAGSSAAKCHGCRSSSHHLVCTDFTPVAH
jgi:hypothetical protein